MIGTRLKPLDFIFIAAVLLFSLFLIFSLRKGSALKKTYAVVKSSSEEYILPLEKDCELTVHGKIGDSVVEVKDSAVRFKHSPCPNKTCVHQGFISKNGEWAACLPNDVFILIEGKTSKDSPDANTF